MAKLFAADWFRRFVAGFAIGLVATLVISSGPLRTQSAEQASHAISAFGITFD